MIDSVTTLGSRHNTSGVVLPWLGITADGERHRLKGLVDRRLTSGNGDDLADANSRRASAGSTTSITSSVRVARIGVKSVALDPAKGFTGVSSVTSSIGMVAIYDLLRRSSGDTTSSNEISGFGFFSGREGPARTTLGLILNRGSLTGGDPVDGSSRTFKMDFSGRGVDGFRSSDTEETSELFDRPVSKHGVTEGGAWAVLVGSGDLFTGGYEVDESCLAFRSRIGSVPEGVELFKGDFVGNGDRSDVVVARSQEGEGEDKEK